MIAHLPGAFGVAVITLVLSLAGAARGANVVINEIMYHPPHDREGLQFVELFNAGATEADLSGWALRKGVQFVFPNGSRVAPGGFLIVCRDRGAFVERYGTGVKVAGQFEGRLSQSGKRLELVDARDTVVDSVKYSDRAPWPLSADGGSTSLERICPAAPGVEAANWAPSNLPKIVAPAGTPGRTNDSYSANWPPIVTEVSRASESPAPGQAVAVSARVADADGVTNVTLLWVAVGNDGAGAEHRLAMRRTEGDAQAGRYEASIPGQPEGRFVRYRIAALDSTGAERLVPSTNDVRPAWSYATFVNTNTACVPLAFVIRAGGERGLAYPRRAAMFGAIGISAARGEDAFVYLPPGGGEVKAFDFIRATPRKGGQKLRLLKDQTFFGMTTLNIIFETPRAALAEPLSYELYRRAGVPAPYAEHWRLWVDGRPLGYQLVFEQVNKSFLIRHGRDDSGQLYKLLWYGRGIVGQHEKKTHLQDGHEDLLEVIENLNAATNAEAQWTFIQKNFNVTNFIDYFAVNMCIQNWDGFFNNYFTYHDTGGTGRWEIYPWDEDKTWGDYDGASERYDWYTMPLTFGMNGSQPPGRRARPGAPSPRFAMGGAMWWRAPGHFSGPLLANPEFRKRFLARLRELCETHFTPATMNPVIDAMEQRLAPEIPAGSMSEFRRHVQSFREQVVGRRKFILEELSRPAP